MALIGAVAVGFLGMLLYALEASPIWQVLATSVMFAGASAAGGGLLGLLFGVPRTVGNELQPSASETAPNVTAPPGIGANTNLEQISDWLTKIIVGVGLTQLVAIKNGAAQLFGAMAPLLGEGGGGAAFAGSIVVYYSVIGFFAGWLYARLRLGLAMKYADAAERYIQLSRRATAAGDPETASAAKAAAAATVGNVTSGTPTGVEPGDVERLAARYEQLRATMPSGPRRTALMEDVVREARQLAQTGSLTAQDVQGTFRIGTEGRRIVALGLMEGDIALADFASALEAITRSLSAFEQYHGLYVANLMLSSLSFDEGTRLQQAVTSGPIKAQMADDTSRTRQANKILTRLQSRPEASDPTQDK